MNGKTYPIFFIFAGCMLLFAGVFLSQGIAAKALELNGPIAMNKVMVSVKNHLAHQEENYFKLREVKKLNKLLNTEFITYLAEETVQVERENHSISARIIGVNDLYKMFSTIKVIEGSFFTDKDDMEKSRVIVIDDEMAWELFNNYQVVGRTVYVLGKQFKIIGVVQRDKSVIAGLIKDKRVSAYIPVQSHLELSEKAAITHVQVKSTYQSTAGKNFDDVEKAIRALGKAPERYRIIDVNIQKSLLQQKPKMILFLMGLSIIIGMAGFVWKRIKSLVIGMSGECTTDYFSSVAKRYHGRILLMLVEIVLAISAGVLIWRVISFQVYIAPEAIPDDLTDMSYYIKLLQEAIAQKVADTGYIAAMPEMEMDTVKTLLDWVFYIGCMAGIFLLHTGQVLLSRSDVTVENTLLANGISLITAITICSVASWILALPLLVDLKGVFIFWCFIFMNQWKIKRSEDCLQC